MREKTDLEHQKEEAKIKLDENTDKIFAQYQVNINDLLDLFNAGFRIGGTRRQYVGGTPSTTYELLIDNVPVNIGDMNTPASTSSFKNTLSAGDKSTLALTLFLSQLERDPNLSQKIVIFDDPFTSQDQSRRTCTQQLLCKLREKAQQVVVLSHSPGFLRLIWDSVPAAEVKTLQFARMGKNTAVTEWDVQDETRSDYFKNHAELRSYLHDSSGKLRHVARAIRPLLEGYLRFKLPGHFTDNEWLGDFIRKIREANSSSSLSAAKEILDELEAINNYSRKYHHDTNLHADSEPLNDGELEGFVKRSLKLVGGF